MFANQRQRAILEDLQSFPRVSVKDLAARFGVAGETIRRDLDALAESGHLIRVHGGAIANAEAIVEPDLPTRRGVNTESKNAIARAAVGLLPGPGQSVLVDAGSTTAALIPELAARDLVLFTHSPETAQDLAAAGAKDVHVLPGRLRPTTRAAVGAATLDALAHLRVSVALIGCNGVSAEGFSTPDPEEGAVKRALVARSALSVILADSAKFHEQSLVTFATWSAADFLVTNAPLPGDLAEAAASSSIEVLTS